MNKHKWLKLFWDISTPTISEQIVGVLIVCVLFSAQIIFGSKTCLFTLEKLEKNIHWRLIDQNGPVRLTVCQSDCQSVAKRAPGRHQSARIQPLAQRWKLWAVLIIAPRWLWRCAFFLSFVLSLFFKVLDFLLVHLLKVESKLHLRTCYDCETCSRCFAYCKGALANRSRSEGILNNANLWKYWVISLLKVQYLGWQYLTPWGWEVVRSFGEAIFQLI